MELPSDFLQKIGREFFIGQIVVASCSKKANFYF